ncbi:MAG: oligosaccharide flippase family protein [Planctomycetota bacterium]
MNRAYLDIIRHSSVYALGQILGRLASFLLLPLYTRYLTIADYGCIAILDLTANVVGILIGSGMAGAVTRHHFLAKTDSERGVVWWSGLTYMVACASLIILPFVVARNPIADALLGEEIKNRSLYLLLSLATLWMSMLNQLPERYLRVRKWSTYAAGLSIVRLLINVSLNVFFLVALDQGVGGILLGNLITGVVMSVILFPMLMTNIGTYRFERTMVSELWTFATPIVVTSLLSLMMQQADRFFLKIYLGLDAVGLFGVSYAIGQGLSNLCLIPFNSIWDVVMYEISEHPDSRKMYTQVFEYFVYGVTLLMFGASLFRKPILALMVAPKFFAAQEWVPYVCLAFLLFNLHIHFKVPALLSKRTTSLVPSSAAAALTAILGNAVFCYLWGITGAAITCVITNAVYSFVGLWNYRQIEVFHYPFKRCGWVLVGVVATFLAYDFAEPQIPFLALRMVVAGVLWIAWSVYLFRPVVRPAMNLLAQRRVDMAGRQA